MTSKPLTEELVSSLLCGDISAEAPKSSPLMDFRLYVAASIGAAVPTSPTH